MLEDARDQLGGRWDGDETYNIGAMFLTISLRIPIVQAACDCRVACAKTACLCFCGDVRRDGRMRLERRGCGILREATASKWICFLEKRVSRGEHTRRLANCAWRCSTCAWRSAGDRKKEKHGIFDSRRYDLNLG